MPNKMHPDTLKSQKIKETITKFSTDPILFIEIFLGRKLSKKQVFFIKKTKTHNHIVAIWSRQSGKSTVIASYILWRLLYGKGKKINNEWMPEHVAIVAPIKDQIKNLYDKIKSLINKSEFIENFISKLNTETIRVKNGNEAKFLSASPGSQIRGYTATCIIIDESQDVTDSKYAADILPFGATTDALVIEAGTPKTKNHFYLSINNKDILTIKQAWYECPFLSESYVMNQKNLSPLSLWKQEYMCEFVEEGVMAFPSKLFEPETLNNKLTGRWNLSSYNYLEKLEQFTREKALEIQELVKNGATFVAGLDLGKQNDNTVYTIFRDDIRPIKLYVQIKFELGTPYTLIAKQISIIHKVFSPYEFNIDYSNEKMFLEELQKQDIPITHGKDNKRGAVVFTNKNKTEMVSTTRILLEQYQLNLPKKAEVLLSQFMKQQFEITSNQQYKYFHPSNDHDDYLWSSLLALKNIHTEMSTGELIESRNTWEKNFDEKIHGTKKESIKDALYASKKIRNRNRYEMAELRRRGSWIR